MNRRFPSESSFAHAILALLLPAAVTGCPAMTPLPTQAPVRERTEPRTQRPYLLYIPSSYSDKRPAPLLVLCHGTWPYDTADREMREWAKFAEERGILVAAPDLTSAHGDLPPPPDKQFARQRSDEAALLAVVDGVKRSYTVAEDRVFLTGWSAGAYPMLYAGLRHPDVFRAIAIRQGTFNSNYLDSSEHLAKGGQRILVIYSMADLIRDQSLAMIEWLRDNGYYVDQRELPGSHRRTDPGLVWDYFQKVVDETPWIRIRALPTDEGPMTVQLACDTAPPADDQKWYFGDGESARDASPTHTYADPGEYDVTVNVAIKGKTYQRMTRLRVGLPEQ